MTYRFNAIEFYLSTKCDRCLLFNKRLVITTQADILKEKLRKMQLIMESVFVLLIFTQPSWLATADDICQIMGKDVVLHRNYKTGETSCCLKITCSPGEEAVICDKDDPQSTACQDCPVDTYQPDITDSAKMLHCIAKNHCRGNQIARYEKSKTRDTHCICNPRLGVCNPAGVTINPRSCVKKTCPPGFRLRTDCTCEACVKPENKNRNEEKPCDRVNLLCRIKRETSPSEISTICPEDVAESPNEGASDLEKLDDIKSYGWSSIPHFSLLTGVTNDRLNDDLSTDQVNKEISWYNIAILVILGAGVVGLVFFIFFWRGCFHKSSRIKYAALHAGVMKPADKKKLSTFRPCLVQHLIIDENFWAILQSNETITSDMKTEIVRSNVTDSAKADALITYLMKRNSYAFATFIAALIYTKQQYLANEVDSDLTLEIERNCKEDQDFQHYVHNLGQSNKSVCIETSHS